MRPGQKDMARPELDIVAISDSVCHKEQELCPQATCLVELQQPATDYARPQARFAPNRLVYRW